MTGLIFGDDIEVSNYVDCVRWPQLKEEYLLSIDKAIIYKDISWVLLNILFVVS